MHYVYHPKHGRKIVPSSEYQHYLMDGWYDTPAKFPPENQIEKPTKRVKHDHTRRSH